MLVLLSCHNEQRDRLWCWCSWSLKSLLKVVLRGGGVRVNIVRYYFFGDRMRERKNERKKEWGGSERFSCCWVMLTCLLRFRARNCTRISAMDLSIFFLLLSNRRLRVPLKLHRLRLSPKSNRHEHESARRPNECDVVREKRLIILIDRDGTIDAISLFSLGFIKFHLHKMLIREYALHNL